MGGHGVDQGQVARATAASVDGALASEVRLCASGAHAELMELARRRKSHDLWFTTASGRAKLNWSSQAGSARRGASIAGVQTFSMHWSRHGPSGRIDDDELRALVGNRV